MQDVVSKETDIQKRGKWLYPSGFHKSIELYNQHRLDLQQVTDFGLVIAEGFWSVIRLWEADIPAVGLMGHTISELQLDQVAALTDWVWLMPDRTTFESDLYHQLLHQLVTRVHVRLFPNWETDSTNQPEGISAESLSERFYG